MKKRTGHHDSNIILSGCSTGIGKQLALTLCRDYNCKIIGLARNEEKLKALKNEIGENFDFIAIDISQKQNWMIIYNRLVEINFCPDILINNAGIIHRLAKFRALTDEILDNTLNTNFLSVVNSIKVLLPLLDKSSKKAIINVSS
ncbi:MAG: SDR family NAD(P)-dependent oxidoreductase, partial [Clostridia bacterium]